MDESTFYAQCDEDGSGSIRRELTPEIMVGNAACDESNAEISIESKPTSPDPRSEMSHSKARQKVMRGHMSANAASQRDKAGAVADWEDERRNILVAFDDAMWAKRVMCELNSVENHDRCLSMPTLVYLLEGMHEKSLLSLSAHMENSDIQALAERILTLLNCTDGKIHFLDFCLLFLDLASHDVKSPGFRHA